eukprot:m.34577 g.34577  ORF g.34577 m.34577 type:complete len:73 (+) comp6539_c5_seq1:335-553(+)
MKSKQISSQQIKMQSESEGNNCTTTISSYQTNKQANKFVEGGGEVLNNQLSFLPILPSFSSKTIYNIKKSPF